MDEQATSVSERPSCAAKLASPDMDDSTNSRLQQNPRVVCWGLGFLGALLVWLAFPPIGCSWLAWVAPVPWLMLVRMPTLGMRRPYRMLWVVGLFHWLLVVHWVRLPHWTTYFGWWALATYLAVYLPLFMVLTRLAVHRGRISVLVAAPVIWTGLEFLRSHLLTGFSMALLAHTQADHPLIIQVAELTGAYGVSFLLMFTAAGIARVIPVGAQKFTMWPLIPVVASITGVCLYGAFRLPGKNTDSANAGKIAEVQVALIQGSVDVTFDDFDPRQAVQEYMELSCQAVLHNPEVDIIVWPESMCTFLAPLITYDPVKAIAPDLKRWADDNTEVFRERLRILIEEHRRARGNVTVKEEGDRPWFIVCSGTFEIERKLKHFNTSLCIDPEGQIVARYDKMHPVMFGEYIPLGHWFDWLYDLTPLSGGLSPGKRPVPFVYEDLVFCPSICFESTVPHLIRRQVVQLTREGHPPDVLINLTNDGWFWGSSELDLHLACGVFRAVENRLPLLIAANTGFSAWINANGQIVNQGPRRATGVILAQISNDPKTQSLSMYCRYGDWFAGSCLIACVVLMLMGLSTKLPPGFWKRNRS